MILQVLILMAGVAGLCLLPTGARAKLPDLVAGLQQAVRGRGGRGGG
ncbi:MULTISPECIES: hypothetical protein [Pseudofrankia]|nr:MULTISPECIES: hypothetical protein [Pseudofrankia]